MESIFSSTRLKILTEIETFLTNRPHTPISINNFLSQLLKTNFSSKIQTFLEFFIILLDENKQINFIRHGESSYNSWRSKSIYNLPIFYLNKSSNYDPRLTEIGRIQTDTSSKNLKENVVDLVIVSPLARALETYKGLKIKGITALACDLMRERMSFACDVGSEKKILEAEFKIVDFRLIYDENWWRNKEEDVKKNGKEVVEKECKENVFIRVLLCVIWILLREEKNILIVSHQNIFQCLFNNFNLFKEKIENCEMKTLTKKQLGDFLVKAGLIMEKKIRLLLL